MTRVRFAPSPTGWLHIGNARAALINCLFARKHGGTFILRLDDTDLERSKPEYEQGIYEDMAWLGLKHDETFRQSTRFPRYEAAAQELKDKGFLYPCYETPEELEYKRRRLLARGLPPVYDRAALALTEKQKSDYEQEGRKAHWRFRLTDAPVVWEDLVRGEVSFQGHDLGDPVLIRADGVFLYSLCSVVDDIDYGITHVLRGEDHVTNTAAQIQMFQAILGREDIGIRFAHTTLLLDASGHALSKRLGSLSLRQLRDQGLEPMAINSLLARLGTSLPVEPVASLDDLATAFDLRTFSRTPPRFDEQDLWRLNHSLYHTMPFDAVRARIAPLDERAWLVLRHNITRLDDLKPWADILYGEISVQPEADRDYLKTALTHLPLPPWDGQTWGIWTNAVKQATGRKGRDLFMPLRQALTGQLHGPEMKEILPLIGYERAKRRLEAIICNPANFL